MYHKNRNYRRSQRERVIAKRVKLLRDLNPDWDNMPHGKYNKRSPLGSCSCGHCMYCAHRQTESWKLKKTRIIAQLALQDCTGNCEDE